MMLKFVGTVCSLVSLDMEKDIWKSDQGGSLDNLIEVGTAGPRITKS